MEFDEKTVNRINRTSMFYFAMLVAFCTVAICCVLQYNFGLLKTKSKVILPEGYELITLDSNLKGYFDKNSTLHIIYDKQITIRPDYVIEFVNDSMVKVETKQRVVICYSDEIQEVILGLKSNNYVNPNQ